MTSHDVVSRVRRATGESAIGHLGTLDPMATGVLPMLLGKYTRLAQFFGPLPKTYTGAISGLPQIRTTQKEFRRGR
jgi:tRNA pseudouridine55 synthase